MVEGVVGQHDVHFYGCVVYVCNSRQYQTGVGVVGVWVWCHRVWVWYVGVVLVCGCRCGMWVWCGCGWCVGGWVCTVSCAPPTHPSVSVRVTVRQSKHFLQPSSGLSMSSYPKQHW